MRRTLNLYARLLALQVRSQLQYRTAFLLDALGAATYTGVWVLALGLVFQRFENVGGWHMGEIAFLYGMVESAFGMMDMIFSSFDPSYFGQMVRRGGLDQLLLRPANLVVQLLGGRFVLRRLGRIAQGLVVFAIALALLDVHWTPAKLLYLPVVYAGLVLFFGGLFVAGSTFSFWTVESVEAVNVFTYGGAEMMSYPMHIYPDRLRLFFTYVIPGAFLNYYPALYFLDKPDPFGLPWFAPFVAPFAGLAVLAAALAAWQYGVWHYQGTGT